MRRPTFVFSNQQFEVLSALLMRRGKGIYDIVELEGFFTAIVIGPHTLMPMTWLPKVWGGKVPKFKSLEDMTHFMDLVMGFYNHLVAWFDNEPQKFQPTFYENRSTGKRILIVDEWCVGFLKGMRMDAAGWKLLQRERPEFLKPMQLFGSPAGWREMKAAGDTLMHTKWSQKITPAVRAIYQYWLPHREARHAQEAGVVKH